MPRRSPTSRWPLLGALWIAGCAPAASQLSGAAVEGAIETVQEPENLDRFVDITADPRMQASVAQLTAAATRGAMLGIEDGPIDQQDLDKSVEAMSAALVRGVGAELGTFPSVDAVIDDAIDGALASATSEENLARTQMLIASITDTMVRTTTSSLAAGLKDDLRPASPVIARVLGDEEIRTAVGAMLYEASRQTTLGVQEAMLQIGEENRAQEQGILGRITTLGGGLFVGLLALLLGMIITVIVLAVRNKRHREQLVDDGREREQILTTLFSALASKDETLDEGVRTALMRYLQVEPGATAVATPSLRQNN